jgi:hypothetical protein
MSCEHYSKLAYLLKTNCKLCTVLQACNSVKFAFQCPREQKL